MTGIGKFLRRLWAAIASLFHKVDDEVKMWVPIAIRVVQGIKRVMDGPVDDVILTIVKTAIPGDADDKLIDKVHRTVEEWIPKVLLQLNLVNSIADTEDVNEKLKAILAQLKLSGDETKNIFYHGIASLILEKLSDGKFDWTDATAVAEYYYQHEMKEAA
ncbi:MAG TPA: hypothetical protein VJ647_01990 [Chitinophagaceae bacterium]|nr:hypothetical protein [Chitinophagaceae bacterium]